MLLVASIFRHGPVLGVYPSAARLFTFTKHVETFTPPYEIRESGSVKSMAHWDLAQYAFFFSGETLY